jgi:hypothetical protein
VRVHVYNGPPRREFVQRIVRTPVVSINLNKIPITNRAKPLIRVEVPNKKHRNGDIPIGTKYKRIIERNSMATERPVNVILGEEVQPPAQRQQSDNPHIRAEPPSIFSEEKAINEVQREREINGNRDNSGQERKVGRVDVRTR